MRNLHIICTPSPKMAKYAVKETPIRGGFLGVDAVVDRMRGTFYDSVGWSGVGYVIHNYDEGEIGAALDYMLSAVRVRAANGGDIAVEYPTIGAHVPDEVDKKCYETIDAIVRVAVACGYMVTLHDLVGYGDIAFGGFDDDDDVFGDPDFGGFAGGDLFGDYDSGEPVSLREEIDAGGLTVQKADRVIALMDEAFEAAPARADADRPLYRGVQARVNYSGVHSTGGKVADASVGDVVVFPEYLSTSTSLAVADDFSDSDGGELTVMEIRTPRGLHMSAVSTHADEDECLLPRNMRLRMVGERRERMADGNVRVVKTFEDAQ
jgi:hypothetical protein